MGISYEKTFSIVFQYEFDAVQDGEQETPPIDYKVDIKFHNTEDYGKTVSLRRANVDDAAPWFDFPASLFTEVVDFLREKKYLNKSNQSPLGGNDVVGMSLPSLPNALPIPEMGGFPDLGSLAVKKTGVTKMQIQATHRPIQTLAPTNIPTLPVINKTADAQEDVDGQVPMPLITSDTEGTMESEPIIKRPVKRSGMDLPVNDEKKIRKA